MVKSARPVLLASSVKCCLNEARGTENPEPESKVRIMPGECWCRCQGWWGGGVAAHCALWESGPGPGQAAAPHMGPPHTCFTPSVGAAWREQLISPGLSSSRARSDFHDMIAVCWGVCGRLPATRCTETRPDLGALLGCTKADTAARTGDHYSYSRHVATHRSWGERG